MRVAGLFSGLGVGRDNRGVRADLGLWKHDTQLHAFVRTFLMGYDSSASQTRRARAGNAILPRMTQQHRPTMSAFLPEPALATARQALRETRLRGLSAAEEYRVIADRSY